MSDTVQLSFDDRDEFNRREVAEKVIRLLNSDIPVSPMVIDGGWGTGKTEFCQKLIGLMEGTSAELQPIYIDAFVADHTDEPLLTILAEVLKLIPDEETRNNTMKQVLPALRFGLKTLAKGAVSHMLRQEAADVVDDFDREISQLTNKAIDASVKAMLQDHIQADQSLATLKTVLQQLAEEKPIVIFIDELDRCRPDFAISMLEVIKHAFDVEGVRFVLVTNTQQLKTALNHRYGGTTVDAQRYLDKFLRFSFTLPNFFRPIHTHHLQQASIAHCQNLIQSSTTLSETSLASEIFSDFINRIIQANQLSLREVETFVRHLEIYHLLDTESGLAPNLITGYKIIRIWGVALFALAPEIAKAAVEEKTDAVMLGSFLGEDRLANWNGGHPYPEHYQVILYALARECHSNRDLYEPPEDMLASWEEWFRSYFSRGGFPPSNGERLPILTRVIKIMMLGNTL